MDKSNRIIFVMGVSGSGKSTIGKKLAQALSLPFFDGDDYHPEANIAKMSRGIPLEDADRKPWLLVLNQLAKSHQNTGGVIACSALKEVYRAILEQEISPPPTWVYLSGSFETISERVGKRKEHFMPKALLQSQFESLEIPKRSIEIPVTSSPDAIIAEILRKL